MAAHVACRPDLFDGHPDTGCSVVCAAHDLRVGFGSSYAVALAACREHNVRHHPEIRDRAPRLLSVVYRSIQTAPMSDLDLAELLLKARHANLAFGVTGTLSAHDGRFLQALEGPEPIVRNLLAGIARDPRHQQLEVLIEELIEVRRFPDWAMASGPVGRIDALPSADCYERLLISRGASMS